MNSRANNRNASTPRSRDARGARGANDARGALGFLGAARFGGGPAVLLLVSIVLGALLAVALGWVYGPGYAEATAPTVVLALSAWPLASVCAWSILVDRRTVPADCEAAQAADLPHRRAFTLIGGILLFTLPVSSILTTAAGDQLLASDLALSLGITGIWAYLGAQWSFRG